MYIQRIHISNIKLIESLDWSIPADQATGWHVIIGDNGSGKSTFLRAISLALIGPIEASSLRLDWGTWLRSDVEKGSIRLDLRYDPRVDNFLVPAPRGVDLIPAAIQIERDPFSVQIKKNSRVRQNPDHSIWSGAGGWFSAAYGPFRRFSGGDNEYERLSSFRSRLVAHLSVFNEAFALGEGLRWLQELQFKRLENLPEGALLTRLEAFINQEDFLPHNTHMSRVTSAGVLFTDANGQQVRVENLSDGYRSILSLTFELIRQMANIYGADGIFDPNDHTVISAPGVVLIDEVDAHLHPSWQKHVGLWFRRHFPNVQFIVTTHSPLVCQSATEGSVWRLPRPGNQERGGRVVGLDLDRLLYGNVLDAYSTEAFGLDNTRSEEAQKKLLRLAQLNRKELRNGLSVAEQHEQQKLRAILPTTAHQTAK